MNYRASVFLGVCLAVYTLASAARGGAAVNTTANESSGAVRNRVTLVKKPAFVLSANTTVDILEGELDREFWRISVKPFLSAEVSFAGGLLAGISLPFALQTGFPFYGTASFEGKIGPPRMELDIAGSSGALHYRVGVSFALPGGSSIPIAGAAATIACIRDPVALRFEVDAEASPAPLTGKWGFSGAGGAAAVLVVLNEIISIEVGVATRLRLNPITGTPPPSVIGKTGLYARINSFTASLFISQDLWNPIYPASVSTGISFSWEVQ